MSRKPSLGPVFKLPVLYALKTGLASPVTLDYLDWPIENRSFVGATASNNLWLVPRDMLIERLRVLYGEEYVLDLLLRLET